MNKLARTNVAGFQKNMRTNVLINTNESAIEQAKAARRAWREKKSTEARIIELEARVARLEHLLRR